MLEDYQLTLTHPLTFGKVRIEKLVFRGYTTAEDYLSFDAAGGVRQRIRLIASISGQDVAIVEKLRGVDYLRAVDYVEKLLNEDEAGAAKSSTSGSAGEEAQEKKPLES